MKNITAVFNFAPTDSVMISQTPESIGAPGLSRRHILVGAGGALAATVLMGAVAPTAAQAARVALPTAVDPAFWTEKWSARFVMKRSSFCDLFPLGPPRAASLFQQTISVGQKDRLFRPPISPDVARLSLQP